MFIGSSTLDVKGRLNWLATRCPRYQVQRFRPVNFPVGVRCVVRCSKRCPYGFGSISVLIRCKVEGKLNRKKIQQFPIFNSRYRLAKIKGKFWSQVCCIVFSVRSGRKTGLSWGLSICTSLKNFKRQRHSAKARSVLF